MKRNTNISDAAFKALERLPYLKQYMSLGIVNNRGLARLIAPDVARDLGSKPNIQSLVTALRRMPLKQMKEERAGLDSILGNSTVNLRYDMASATLKVGSPDMEKTKRKLLPEGSYILLQGMETLTIAADESTLKKVEERLADEILDLNLNLAIVVVKSPKAITKTPGVLAYLANILALEKINIVEMMSSHAETAFIVAEADALRTIGVLRREIKRARAPL